MCYHKLIQSTNYMQKQYMHFTLVLLRMTSWCYHLAHHDIPSIKTQFSLYTILLFLSKQTQKTSNDLFQLKYILYRIKNRLEISFKSAISLSINVLNPCYWPSTVQAVIMHCPTYHLFPMLVCSRKTDSCNSISLFNLRTIWL